MKKSFVLICIQDHKLIDLLTSHGKCVILCAFYLQACFIKGWLNAMTTGCGLTPVCSTTLHSNLRTPTQWRT